MELKIDKNFINNRDTEKFSWRKALTLLAFIIICAYAFYFIPFGVVLDIPKTLGAIVIVIVSFYFGKRAFTGVSEAVGNFVKSKTKT